MIVALPPDLAKKTKDMTLWFFPGLAREAWLQLFQWLGFWHQIFEAFGSQQGAHFQGFPHGAELSHATPC